MPSLTQHHATSVIKMLNIGDSGTGKTGALGSLARAGYRLWILDYDNGLDILALTLKDDPKALERVTYETLRDHRVFRKGIPTLVSPITAYTNAGITLEKWQAAAGAFGPQDVVVIDTLTTFSKAAMNFALNIAGRLNSRIQLTDYGDLARGVLAFIDTITSEEAKFNVIVNSHVKYMGGDEEAQTMMKGLPNSEGQQVSKDVSLFFNTIVLSRTQGSGPATKRVISTQPQGVVQVKVSNPPGIKPSYPIETGLAALFADILGHGPSHTTPVPASPATGTPPTAPETETQPKETA